MNRSKNHPAEEQHESFIQRHLLPVTLFSSLFIVTALLYSFRVTIQSRFPQRDYLYFVETFAHTLIDNGLDKYGTNHTPVWVAVMDTRDFSVPREGVPTVEGIRAGDRALGGSNLYHDVKTLSAFSLLSEVTGNAKYKLAADQYKKYFLENAQSPQTGLLAWGEHLYYDLYSDSVSIEKRYKTSSWGGYWHELLRDSPPWDELWETDSIRAEKAIAGIRYHFYGPEAKSFLFNRHAHWDKAVYQSPEIAQPWIKHSGLYTHAFMFLYAKTGKQEWLGRAKGISTLYWDRRNQETNLTLSCIGDPRASSMDASLSGTSSLAYHLLKAYLLDTKQEYLKDNALTLFRSIDKYAWDKEKGTYYSSLELNGTPVIDTATGRPNLMKAWVSGYGKSSILEYGRRAAYFAYTLKKKQFLEIAERCIKIAGAEPFPEQFVAENIADAIHLNLDMYDLTKNKQYLESAAGYADIGIQKLWKNGLFVRQTNDDYYEAKLGIGSLVSGLLRLHLLKNPGLTYPGFNYWNI